MPTMRLVAPSSGMMAKAKVNSKTNPDRLIIKAIKNKFVIFTDSVTANKHGLLEFAVSDNKLTSKVQRWNTPDTPQLESIKLLGVTFNVNEVTVNRQPATMTYEPNNVNIFPVLSNVCLARMPFLIFKSFSRSS